MAEQHPVLVTGVGGGGIGEQILKALRLASTPFSVVGTDITPYSSGLARVDHPYVVPLARDPDYVDVLLRLCRDHGVRMLCPGSEPELRVCADAGDAFAEAGVVLAANPTATLDICLDKLATANALRSAGLDVPLTAEVTSLAAAMAFPTLPAVLKPATGGGGSADVYLVQDRDTLAACVTSLLKVRDSVMIQAYIGTPDDEYTVGVLHDLDGAFINAIAVRRDIRSALSNRLRQRNDSGRPELGDVLAVSSGITQGEIGAFPDVCAACEPVAAAVGAAGPLNVQCRFVDGRAWVFEINPRFSGTTSMRAMVGFNEPDLLYRHQVLGEDVPRRFSYGSGVLRRSLEETLISDPQIPDLRTAP
jgi:carbamoyl-phosphate synthase large subunit